jgi:hypothetical protein
MGDISKSWLGSVLVRRFRRAELGSALGFQTLKRVQGDGEKLKRDTAKSWMVKAIEESGSREEPT